MREIIFLFMVDTSGSMYGEKISAVNAALAECMDEIRQMGGAGAEKIKTGFIAFDERMKILSNIEEISQVSPPVFRVESAPDGFCFLTSYTCLYEGVYRLIRDRFSDGSDRMLYMFLITDGKPCDLKDDTEKLESLKYERAFKSAKKYIVLTEKNDNALVSDILEFVDQRADRIMQLSDLTGEISKIRVSISVNDVGADNRNAIYDSIFGD